MFSEAKPVMGGFGRGGDWIVYDTDCCHSSGYGKPASPHATETLKEFPGTPLLDQTTADLDAAIDLSFGGPMVSGELPPNTMRRTTFGPERPIVEPYTPGVPRSLDYVSVDVHMALWRSIGARVGVVAEDGSFQWSD